MRFLMKSKSNSSIPGRLEDRIGKTLPFMTVVPLRKIWIASSFLGWRLSLNLVDASATLESKFRDKNNNIIILSHLKMFALRVEQYLSWVSLRVLSSSLNRSRKSDRLKWRSTSSSLSTTHELRAFLWACRWKIFSSIVPVCKIITQKFRCFLADNSF